MRGKEVSSSKSSAEPPACAGCTHADRPASLGILASGHGSNMEAIAEACARGELAAKVSVVISDKKEAYVLERAKRRGIPHYFVDYSLYPNRRSYEEKVLDILHAHGVQYIVLAGYMRVVGEVLLQAYPQRILNIHPSLLPAFPGLSAIRKAYEYGVQITGVTVHFVDEGVDTGPILQQEVVPIGLEDSLESLEKKVHEVEHRLYKKALALLISGRVEIYGRKIRFKN